MKREILCECWNVKLDEEDFYTEDFEDGDAQGDEDGDIVDFETKEEACEIINKMKESFPNAKLVHYITVREEE